MDGSNQQQKTVQQRFATVPADQFREQIVGLRQASDALIDTIVESVENGWITPLQGVSLIASNGAAVYGGTTPLSQGDLALALEQRVPMHT